MWQARVASMACLLSLIPLLLSGALPARADAVQQPRRFLPEIVTSEQANPGGPDTALVGGLVAGGAVCVIIAAAFAGLVWIRAKGNKINPAGPDDGSKDKDGKKEGEALPHQTSLLYMTFNDVQVATEGFKPEGTLSETMYASVHKAEGPGGEKWAVKCAKEVSLQGEHLFRNEVEFLARIVHENIVPLRAFCDEGDEQILVFDYMPNGSLASWLRPPPEVPREPLSLAVRHRIAVDVADALRFLHSFSHPKIIHRDLQSDSILLNGQFKAKVGGLGLLKHLPGDSLRMRMASKKGYLDPEYFQTFKVTTKCDVYSFGVVLFEMLTGCAPMVQVSRSETQRTFTLSQWAKQAVEEGKLDDILDPRLPRDDSQAWREMVDGLARIACACVTPLRRHRPDMAKVADQLAKLGQASGDSKCTPRMPWQPKPAPSDTESTCSDE